MGTAGYLILVALAVVLSAQLLMLMGRRKPIDKHLRDLGDGGDALGLLCVALLLGGTLGALVGNFFHYPGPGTAAGLTAAFLTWTAVVIRAHQKPQPPPRHRNG